MERTHPPDFIPTSHCGCLSSSITPGIKHSKVTCTSIFATSSSKLEIRDVGPSWHKERLANSCTQDASAVSTLQMFGDKGVILQERNLVGLLKGMPYHNTETLGLADKTEGVMRRVRMHIDGHQRGKLRKTGDKTHLHQKLIQPET